MFKAFYNILIVFIFVLFCFSGCYQMGRAVGKAENQVEKLERKIEKAGDDFERGYEKEKK